MNPRKDPTTGPRKRVGTSGNGPEAVTRKPARRNTVAGESESDEESEESEDEGSQKTKRVHWERPAEKKEGAGACGPCRRWTRHLLQQV